MSDTEKALRDLVRRLLDCAELNQDDIEPETEALIDEAEQALECMPTV